MKALSNRRQQNLNEKNVASVKIKGYEVICVERLKKKNAV